MKEGVLSTSSRIEGMGVSKILQLAQAARELRANGVSVIDLSAGQPDFDTPDNVKSAAKAAIDAGQTRYTALDGTAEMKDAVREKFRRDNNLSYERNEVMVGAGAKQLIFNAFMATLDAGDEVILPTPCWLSYFDIVKIAGAKPVAVSGQLEAGYKITPDQLRKAITPKSRWILLNSPSNPSGAVYSAAELAALLEVIADHPRLWVMADDVYEHIRFGDTPFATPAAIRPDLKQRILTVNAVSKAFAMTGWRLGYAGGAPELIRAMSVVQSQSTSNPCSVSQAAAVEALTGPQGFLDTARTAYARRRDILINGVSAIDGIEARAPEGSFFAFVRITDLLERQTPDGTILPDDNAVSDYLLDKAKVVTVPGSEFGLPGHLRLSFAVADTDLSLAVERMKTALDALQPVKEPAQ
ncbi:pyridoxal phosphate-dependent aminotransferase [Ruegeria sp.]|uniref:pyridoxal phosphate-dependent aminotransferase n=1 Tax=Ruegeria sp. TaxID=1879320 RepID=UPI0023213D36|nr:pyridoxal phosphate-dependent aminotransferase [Ruegeria sp.]MDA7965562.1 pyridoxal phosphate-dependent aminotransferase [Ruegeria sp.]